MSLRQFAKKGLITVVIEKFSSISDVEISVRKSINFAIGFIIVLLAVYFLWFGLVQEQGLSSDSQVWGTFGDFIGGALNPIIAFLAFYWLTQSVLIQKKELSETQKVLAETEKATKEQAKTQEKQRFENSFYSLLEQVNSVGMELKSIQVTDVKKRSKLKRLYNKIFETGSLEFVGESSIPLVKDEMRDCDSECNYYFRLIYHLLKFILMNFDAERKEMSFEESLKTELLPDEKFYSSIVRSFLDKETTQLLAINCICDTNSDFYKYRLLIERYEMLEHLNFEYDWMNEILNYYDIKAFGRYI